MYCAKLQEKCFFTSTHMVRGGVLMKVNQGIFPCGG
jgi:hypothetical protein